MDVAPPQTDQLADSETRIDCHIDHRGVRFLNQLDQRRELLRSNEGLVPALATLVWRQLHALDPQGASVPNAKATITNVGQNTSFTTTTDAGGGFLFPHLLPANYTLTVEMEGFKKYQQQGLVLLANSAVSLPPVKLEVGAVTQAVEVVAQGEQLKTSTAERGDTIVSQQLENVQVRGRTYLGLLQLNPGVRTDRDFSTNTNELGNIFANGSRGNQQHLTLNGVTNTDYGANGRMTLG